MKSNLHATSALLIRMTMPSNTLKIAVMVALNTISFNSFAEVETLKIEQIAVTANPLGATSDELVTPVAVLNGRELSLKRESTLGETLNSIPGVSSSQFGPNASRPVIRGMDAERVRIMQNGVGVLDASSLSFDHAVSIDPLIIEQIDVVRGPAALLYGGSAVGGVVNAIDHRIPKEKLDGITGRSEVRFGGADNSKNGAIVMDVGNGDVALHADVYGRESDDLNIPNFAVSKRKANADGTPRINKGELINSDAKASGGAFGASLTFDQGYAGFSYSHFDSNYGTVAEPGVRIDMQSDRIDFAGEVKDLSTFISGIKTRFAYTDYQHVELEDGAIGTTFNNLGVEGSLEAHHQKILGFDGVIGYQTQNTTFSALGAEAFVPTTNTVSNALYIYEETQLGKLKLSLGDRLNHVSVDSSTDTKFGAGKSNSFNLNSYSLGGLYAFNDSWSLGANLSHSERAPSYFELYADGAHIASNQFEVGSAKLDKERANTIDAQIRWKKNKNSFSFGGYYTRFSNFVGLFNTGNLRGTDGELNPIDADNNGVADGSGKNILAEAVFAAVPATFKGLEFEGKYALNDYLSVNIRGDYVHARDTRNNDYLPRITPARLGAGVQYVLNGVNLRLDVLQGFAQNHTANNELATDSYTNISALAAYQLPRAYTGHFNVELFAKANNLLNDEIREHSSILKDISPAGERSVLVGLRADF